MKIQILTNLYPSPWEPNRATFNKQQFDTLAKSHELRVTVLVAWIGNLFRTTKLLIPDNGISLRYLKYFYIPKILIFTHPITLFFSLLFEAWRIKKYQPDFLLVSWAFPEGVSGVMLAKLLNVPVAIKIHGSDINMHCQSFWRAKQVVWAMNNSNAVFSVSQALRSRLMELGVKPEKIHIVYNGIDRDNFAFVDRSVAKRNLGLDLNRRFLLYIGNLKREKGCNDLLQAFKNVAVDLNDVDLVYIGSGKEFDVMNAEIEQSDLSGRVKFLGSIPHKELPQWINASHLVALPSHSEGVPNVLLESMACGVPVVATRVGGIPEVVPLKAGILVEKQDIASLSLALKEAVLQDWDRKEIQRCVEEMSWDKNAGLVTQVFEEQLRVGKKRI